MKKTTDYIKLILVNLFALLLLVGCNSEFLEEEPLDRFSPENSLVDYAGFEAYIVSLHRFAREENFEDRPDAMSNGTDVSMSGVPDGRFFSDYTLINAQSGEINAMWNWAYTKMIKVSNLIITRAENPEVKWTEEEKNKILAEAKFFRAYTYNALVNLFGGVPIIDEELVQPRFDFSRATRLEVLNFIKEDLEFAVLHLPIVTNSSSNGRIYKAAGLHLLSEVYISLGQETGDNSYYDKSIEAASDVIDGSAGEYKLMTERFGNLSRPGDVFSDLFWTNQQNRASGNLETIWVIQFEFGTPGGGEMENTHVRWWGPKFEDAKDLNNKNALLVSDSLGRSQGGNRGTDYFHYQIWDDANDMRNSQFNIRRKWFVNNPASSLFGQEYKTVKGSDGKLYAAKPDGSPSTIAVDTLRVFFPMIRKVEGEYPAGANSGRTSNDKIRMRLAETYLLRAEAYLHKGNLALAAADLNVVRQRANAYPIAAEDVTLDFILDERARELIIEEPRRRTLTRLNKLYERTKKYNARSQSTIQPFNEVWPIPQAFIDANNQVEIPQNPGYPGA
ncbi:RagB/SusD family nutrient uptake outer membrane protein [Algoriphagus aestuariicola]|uniref:RagB/SusD family nutrient uptake outer membrane protein n=1 Tax=Algoriphagus aestuariicola TaxID=1852016 RepID=A0ABS3BP36_9BACT|nr:RagB/SusD family nutrient uptake outer membrane protein [Algoriphagus aestuariicola]MBN7800085.1 RagB/SusD family nutrient uptake outer membrane protein [Algoriphagus aestuariicola]